MLSVAGHSDSDVLSVLSRSAIGAGGVLVAALTAVGCSGPDVGAPLSAPDEPFSGEVARFSFVRSGSNKVSLGPYAVTADELVAALVAA